MKGQDIMDNAVISAIAAALAAEEEAGGLPTSWQEEGGVRPGGAGRARLRDSVSSEDSFSLTGGESTGTALLAAFSRSPAVPTKYFLGKGVED